MIVLELCATISVWFAQRFGEAIVAVILAKLLEWLLRRDRLLELQERDRKESE